jgi:UDP-N-acetylmuramate-alanine ligase
MKEKLKNFLGKFRHSQCRKRHGSNCSFYSLGIDFETIKTGISTFKGIKRRYETFFCQRKIYVDDYAHHPTELNAVIGSIRTFNPGKKLLVVFQPHSAEPEILQKVLQKV